jgi:phosphomannomutase
MDSVNGLDPSIFRRYDIRGVVPRDLDENGAEQIGRAFAKAVKPKEVVVGRDVRLTGPALKKSLIYGLTKSGVDVIDIGTVSTDSFYFASGFKQIPGLMVTASHNPPEYNGVKMVRVVPDVVGSEEVQKALEEGLPPDAENAGSVREEDITDIFISSMLKIIPPEKIKPLKVVVDTSNGSQGKYWEILGKKLPIKMIPQFFEADGNFPNHDNDIIQPDAQKPLRERVIAEKADLGLIFDPDGDRCLVVDDRGITIPGDFLTALLAETMLKSSPGSAIVYDIRASDVVGDIVNQAGGRPVIWKIGHAFIKPKMQEENAIFGGEVSGHFYFKDFWFADSGLLAGLAFLEYVSSLDVPLSTKIKELENKYFLSGEINSIVDDHDTVLERIKEKYSDGELNELDGVAIRYPDWRFVLRTGANPPGILRLTLEAKNKELMEQKRDEVLQLIRQ